MANNGWISNFKVSIELYGHSASNYHFTIFKNPLKFQKIKNIYKEASNQKVIENRPPKSGNSDAKYKFKNFKNQKLHYKKTP